MTESNKVFIAAILITGMVVFLTVAGSVYFLYHTAVEEQKERLLEVVENQADFIEVVHENASAHGKDMTLAAHQDTHNELKGIFNRLSMLPLSSGLRPEAKSPALRFYIAERRGDSVRFHIGPQKLTRQPVPFHMLAGKPMGRALEGETHVLETKDHMGNPILCAYTYVGPVGLGIVAKIFLEDLRRPFIRTALITYGGAFALVFLSGLIMRRTVSPLVAKLENQHSELENKNKYLHKLATTDSLTNLYNRQHFNEHLEYGIRRSERYNQKVSLILFDIDHFKQINDAFGHLAGDTVLRELSTLIRTHIRKSDVLARWGGEEFVLLVPEAGKEATHLVAEKLCRVVSEYEFGINRQVTCSFGSTVHIPGESTADFINRADKGLYEAKKAGRNRVVSQ